MDDFVRSIKEEVKTQKLPEDIPLSNFRELLSRFIVSKPQIKIEEVFRGDITFSIAIKDVGLNFQDIQKYRVELYSYLVVNLMGELLVRENIDTFAKILTKVDKDAYSDVVNGYEHRKFGLKIMRNRLHFGFHISLIQSILTEDFRREIRRMERS